MSQTHIKLNSTIYSLADFKIIGEISYFEVSGWNYYTFGVSLMSQDIEITVSNDTRKSYTNIYSENPEKYSKHLRNHLIELWRNFQKENIYEIPKTNLNSILE